MIQYWGAIVKVEQVILSNGKTRYMLVDKDGEPIQPVLQYLRFKDNSNAARNTLRSYCFHLKLFFEFLEQEKLDYHEIGIDRMASFMGWLQNPYGNNKIISISISSPPRKPRTINAVLATVIGFYDYLMRHEDYSIQLSERLKKQITGSRRNFKDFLYHINKDKKFTANILKAKVPKEKPKVISKEQVVKLIYSCSNIRDHFLIQLLWESSMRIGEALSLWLEDFQVDARKVHICDRGELENFAEIKTVYSPRIIDVSEELMDLYFEYIAEIHTDEVDTNHVFIKLSGENKQRPLEYTDVVSLFNRLKQKTGIHVTPHMLRHTSLTELRKSGWKDEHLMKRAGHAHIQTTLQMYVHPSDDDLRKDWERTQERMKINSQKGDS